MYNGLLIIIIHRMDYRFYVYMKWISNIITGQQKIHGEKHPIHIFYTSNPLYTC